MHDKTEGAWCVKPHSFDDYGLRVVIHKVRVEISDVGCQHEPRYLDTTLTVEPREIGRYNDITLRRLRPRTQRPIDVHTLVDHVR